MFKKDFKAALEPLKNLRKRCAGVPTGVALTLVVFVSEGISIVLQYLMATHLVVGAVTAGLLFAVSVCVPASALYCERRFYSRRKADVLLVRKVPLREEALVLAGVGGVVVDVVLRAFQALSTDDLSAAFNLHALPLLALAQFLLWQSRRWLREYCAPEPVVYRDHRVVTGGPYRLVRHPMYTSFLLSLASLGLLCNVLCRPVPGSVFVVSLGLVARGFYRRALVEEQILPLPDKLPDVPRFLPKMRNVIAYIKEPTLPLA